MKVDWNEPVGCAPNNTFAEAGDGCPASISRRPELWTADEVGDHVEDAGRQDAEENAVK